jgi:hypothetical protein
VLVQRILIQNVINSLDRPNDDGDDDDDDDDEKKKKPKQRIGKDQRRKNK